MYSNQRRLDARLLCGAGLAALMALSGAAQAQTRQFNIPAAPLGEALALFGSQSDRTVVATSELTRTKTSRPVSGDVDADVALAQILEGSGLTFRQEGDVFLVVQAGEGGKSPQGASVGDVDALIVTAQKREENIQDVPIAISAFSQQDLTDRQVAGGPDLITQIPNMSFTKTNFSGYSIQIRGIGTQAISATTDPAVAVAFNNTPFIRNRFFEQEFYDLERVEVLRGPQGTLYGRNATAGVVNLISGKPKFSFDSRLSADIGNYANRRYEGMVNIPLVEDKVALRLAGAWTKRDGYATNQMTGGQIDGRDLWSVRASLRFEPTDGISANFIYEHFNEDDDRLRSGKQLCKKHIVSTVGGLNVDTESGGGYNSPNAYINQGCTAVSLYSEEAFQTPNGFSLPYYGPLCNFGTPVFCDKDPYRSATQSRDLRVIESSIEPNYRASADIGELQLAIDLSDSLTLNSETSYSTDGVFSLQDYNRYTTAPRAFNPYRINGIGLNGIIDLNGVFCDPQLGCSDRLLLVDLSTSESSQFSQEFRLGSDFDGPLNFSFGANYLRHDTLDKYYVFINTISLVGFGTNSPEGIVNCFGRPGATGDTAKLSNPTLIYTVAGCIYTDPNPIGSLNDQGRNYFLSLNPYKLISYAAFGEIYYELTPDLKITGGLRYTVDRKSAPQIPSWLIAGGGNSVGPYPTLQVIDQEWREPSGRLAIDWNPDLPFTEQTLLYASYAHGYKAGGANPPPPVFSTYGAEVSIEPLPDVFDAEFVDAFEVGAKNTLFGGALTLNLTGFYYDYEGYQVSEIRNRSAVNSNYDSKVWGAEIEADWRATEALRLGFKGGYNGTRIADGESNIDLMDRTAGDPDWVVMRPFPAVPSNCIIPVYVVAAGGVLHLNPGISTSTTHSCIDAYVTHIDPVTQLPFDPTITDYSMAPKKSGGVLGAAYANYPGWDPLTAPNGGKGISKQLGGNELPNAPNYTATVTADYTLPLAGDWLLTLHGDYHYQSQSWGRVFNSDPYDRINAFSTVNLAGIVTNEDAGWKVMAYIKNVFDETAITGTFLNSDDSGLTTNVFLTEPRLYGVRITKDWTGGGLWWMGERAEREPGKPYPFWVEIGAGMSRFEAPVETYAPAWVSPALAPSLVVQDDQLDWGDIRDVKVTYAPAGGWKVSAAYMYGKTNGQGRGAAYQDVPGASNQYNIYIQNDNHAITAVRDDEEYAVVDFMVGKEIGLGAWTGGGKSTVSAGLRYASFQSMSGVDIDGASDGYVSPIQTKYVGIQSRRTNTNSLDSVREFEGFGPMLSWESAMRLFGDDQSGHGDFDWSIGGGVLFGKQTTTSGEDRFTRSFYSRNNGLSPVIINTTLIDDVVPVVRERSEDVSVPTLSLSAGLSYSVDRVKVSTGYRYDRFFDAIDGGFDAAKTYDRTIHGPYLKLSLGFGG